MSELLENEETEDLNEMVDEEVDDGEIITVPIDETLTRHGEAADAKTVGDRLALKADKSEVQANITVDGQSKDANGNILVKAEHIPYSDEKDVKEAIENIDAKTAEDIPMSEGENPQSIAEAISNAAAKTADQIPMEIGSLQTVAEKIGNIDDALDDIGDAIDEMQEEITQGGAELTDEEVHQIVNEVFDNNDTEEEGE